MKDFIHAVKVLGVWTLIQLVWAGIGLGTIYALDLTPSHLQLFGFVATPYLLGFAVLFYDTMKSERI